MTNTLFRAFLFSLAFLLAASIPAIGQTPVTQTTLSAAVSTASQRQVFVASVSGITATTGSAQQFIMIDKELMLVNTVASATLTLTVSRGYGPTLATKHNSGATVTFGPAGILDPSNGSTSGVFVNASPIEGTTCADGLNQYASVFNAQTGTQHTCVSGAWRTAGLVGSLFFTDVAYNASDFGAATGTWTVDAADVKAFHYLVINKLVILQVSITDSANSNDTANFTVELPAAICCPVTVVNAPAIYANMGTHVTSVYWEISANASTIRFLRESGANFPASAGPVNIGSSLIIYQMD